MSSLNDPAARPKISLAWTVALLVLLPLLSVLAPRYEAAGVLMAPLSPALVLAVGAATLFGWRALPAIAVAATLAAWGWPMAWPDARDIVSAGTLVAQAAFSGLLLRHSGRADDVALDNRPALRRLIAAAVSSGLIGGLAQAIGDLIWAADTALRPVSMGLVRATADAASILILLPVVLAYFGGQRERWLSRRLTVALPLLALASVLWLAFSVVDERDRNQAQMRFERDAEVVFARTQALLDAPVQALQAVQGAFKSATAPLGAAQFDSLAQPWVKRSLGMVSLGWVDVPAAPAAAASGAVTSPPPAPMSAPMPAPLAAVPAAELISTVPVVRHMLGSLPLLPAAGNVGSGAGLATGSATSAPVVSLFELALVRQTSARAAGQDAAAVSAPVPLGVALEARPGFVLLQSLPTASSAQMHALAFAVMSAETLVAPILAARSDGMRACLFDTDERLTQRRLAGASGCDGSLRADHAFARDAGFDFAGRRWTMRVSQAARTSGGVWLFALPALCGAAVLAVLLAGITGKVQRVRAEARTRGNDLRHELDHHQRDLVEHERTVHALMDTVQIGMAMIGPQGRIQRVNGAFAELAGKPAEALRGQALDDVLVDDEQPQPGALARLIQDSGDALAHQTLRLRNTDGRVLPSLVTLRVLRDGSGRALSAICAVHDLSENLRRRHVERVLGNVLDLARPEVKPVPSSAAQTAPARPVHRILCITSDPALPGAVRDALHNRPGAEVVASAGGAQLMDVVRAHAPHLVLVDLDGTAAPGLATLRSLAANGVRAIVLSRDLRPQGIDDAFAAGARGYLTLPLEVRELLAVLDTAS